MRFTHSCLFLLFININGYSSNKYSKSANINFKDHFDDDPPIIISGLEKPFRMAKLNLLWVKAKARLSEPKLKSLYSDLKLHDKEEISLKHFKVSNGDKDGLKEAEIRKKLIGIMSTYDLLEHFKEMGDVRQLKDYDNAPENYMNNIFKDKKLNKLWTKAQMAGFGKMELQMLKEEFSHHQDKLEQYYSLLNEAEKEERENSENSVNEDLDRFNAIDYVEEPKKNVYADSANAIRTKSRELKDGYDRLERLAAQGPDSKEFIEPKVQNLWKLAINGNFSRDELHSLRTELHHYEKRLLKLRDLHLDAVIDKDKKLAGEKANSVDDLHNTIKKQSRKVQKLHMDLESRILSRTEL